MMKLFRVGFYLVCALMFLAATLVAHSVGDTILVCVGWFCTVAFVLLVSIGCFTD